jgi:cytochrome c biogenesis protein ResB
MVVKNDPGQVVIWVAFACLLGGLVGSFYFQRRRAWARIEGARVGLAFLADPSVDREREYRQLVEAVERRLRPRADHLPAAAEVSETIIARR